MLKNLRKRIALLILTYLIIFHVAHVSGQGFEDWSVDIGGEDTEHFKAIAETSDKGFIVAGYVEDFNTDDKQFYLVKTDSLGTVEWSQLYGGSSDDDAYCVLQTSDDDYLVGGRTKSSGAGLYDVWIVKTDPSGNLLWDRTFGGEKDDTVYSLIDIGNSEYIAVGSKASDAWLLKMNGEGELLWNITIGGSKFDIGKDVMMSSDGGFIMLGETSSYGAGWNDIWLVKLDQDGSVIWNNTYGGSANEAGYAAIETGDGYLLVGTSESFGNNLIEGYVVKVDSDGNLDWEKTYGGASDDYIQSITETEQGYIAVGYTTSTGTGESDIWVLSISPTGDLLEETFYGGSLRDRVYQIEPTSDGGYVLVGFTWSFGASGNGYLIKITMEEPEPEPEPEPEQEPEEESTGIPGFPIITLMIGLLVFLLINRRT